MQQELFLSEQKTRSWIAVLACACLVACAKTSTPEGGADGESHFLAPCEQSCADGLECVERRCTTACDDDDACHTLNADAACVRGGAAVAEPHCDVPCTSNGDCLALGQRFVCADAYCRSAPDGGGKRAAGEPCTAASQCASGGCEGMGCGDDSPGLCTGVDRGCTEDIASYCGCDGTTFFASGSCPGQRYALRGPCCHEQGRYQAGKEGGYRQCCDGLTEVFWQVPATQEGEPVCVEPIGHREYACVSGTCGDGRCEAGEDGACGCAADCPGAVWVGSGIADGEPCESGDDCRSGICEGRGCGADQPGACAPRDRACTDDDVEYCGCDGVTFHSSGSCAGARYAHQGGC